MTGDLCWNAYLLFMAGNGAIIVYVLFEELVRRRIAHKARLTDLGTPVCPICDHRSRLMSAPCSRCGFHRSAPPTPQESALQELAIAIACYEAAGTEFQKVLNAAANHGMDQIVDRPKHYLECSPCCTWST